MNRVTQLFAAMLLCLSVGPVTAQELFSELVGSVPIKAVPDQAVLEVPYITWGGDVATFLANGGLETKSGSIFAGHDLKLKLTAGDDFVGQVKNYLSGRTPFLRGTFRMLGQASEVIGSDPRTKPVVVLQLSWSAGDHMVSREGLKTLNDLKRDGKKVRVACQQGGPHVGLLYDALAAAQLTKDDIEVVFVPDLTGENGPAERFRKDATIDACCVITPDMIGLTGGVDSVGTGAEGTVQGARVLVSTQNMSRSIADVYAVRSDWFQANQETVQKFVAGYLKASDEVVRLRDDFEKNQRMSPPYRTLLQMSQQIFGEEVVPTLEVDAHGLLLDCNFVGLPGQIAFFQQSGNLAGFDPKLTAALDLATSWGYARSRNGFEPASFDYKALAELAGVEYRVPKTIMGEGPEGTDVFFGEDLDPSTIVSFTISFEPNQTEFSVDRYGAEFNRALQGASTFGGAAVVIRGHSDPTKTLVNLIRAGMSKGIIQRTGQRPNFRYFLRTDQGSNEINLNNTAEMVDLIESGAFEGAEDSPLQTMQAALNLSLARAEAVKGAIIEYAKSRGINVNLSQLQPLGAGITDPVITKPTSMEEAKQNMRVEFRIVKVNPEELKESDFDF
jgi:ABC-type nitrate/sulfonate/bicarbonate transport system substrate-binding protein